MKIEVNAECNIVNNLLQAKDFSSIVLLNYK
jgi:hypothetical protein